MRRLKLVVLASAVLVFMYLLSIPGVFAAPLAQPAQATQQPTVPPPSLTIKALDNGKTFNVPVNSSFILDLPSGLYDIQYDTNILRLLPNQYMAIIGHRRFEFYAAHDGTTTLALALQPCSAPCPTPTLHTFSVTIVVGNGSPSATTAPTAASPGTLSPGAMIRLGLGIGTGIGLLVGLGVLNP